MSELDPRPCKNCGHSEEHHYPKSRHLHWCNGLRAHPSVRWAKERCYCESYDPVEEV